jgi:hypothetical protein
MEQPMTASFTIDYAWLPREYGDAVERVTLAELAISCKGFCATTLEDVLAKTVRSSARLSAIRLAEWFAANWWRLLWEPSANTLSWKLSHKVGNAGGGYVWPDLSFSSDWESIHISSRRTEGWEGEPLRYLNDFDARISAGEFERGVENFVNGTIARLSSTLGKPTELSELWELLQSERQDPVLSDSRKLEALMGYDPDEAPDGLIDRLQAARDSYGRDAVQEIAAVSKSQTLFHIEKLLNNAAGGDAVVRLSNFDTVQQRIATQFDNLDVPWRRARRVAKSARDSWGLNGRVDTRTLSEIFSIPEAAISQRSTSTTSPLTAGVRNDDVAGHFRFLSNRRHPTARRFALARLVADHLTIPDDERLLPATDSKTGRQKFQRAFAQEFLCPFDDLMSHFDGDAPIDDAIDESAEYFDVSPRLVETALVNNGVLDREMLGDWPG